MTRKGQRIMAGIALATAAAVWGVRSVHGRQSARRSAAPSPGKFRDLTAPAFDADPAHRMREAGVL